MLRRTGRILQNNSGVVWKSIEKVKVKSNQIVTKVIYEIKDI